MTRAIGERRTQVEILPEEAHVAGLRTRLVGRLTGLSSARLRYWHESELLEASLRPGQRGIPRLYSWVDYLRLQIAAHLEGLGVPTVRIRQAVDYLDGHFPAWYLLTERFDTDERAHVRVRAVESESPLLADVHGQHILELDWPSPLADLRDPATAALEAIAGRGSLCRLRDYSDAVFMTPRVNLAQPSIVGTALETCFIFGVSREVGEQEASDAYRVDPELLKRAIAFEEAVA